MIDLVASAAVPTDVSALAIPVFEGGHVPPGAGADVDVQYLASRGFAGRLGETFVLPADDGSAVVVVGVGREESVTADALRRAAAAALRAAWREEAVAMTLLAARGGIAPAAAAQAVGEGAALAAYRFGRYKSDPKAPRVDRVIVVGGPARAVSQGVERATAVAGAVSLARDLVNEPAGTLTPTELARIAVERGGAAGLDVDVWDEKRIVSERLGGLLGVAKGSAEPPRLIMMRYTPKGRARAHVALVGKGITFDSGGLNIKTLDGMKTMKTDMSGAAAVIATMTALDTVAPPVAITAIVPATENMPGGTATRPGDVLVARNGKTMEVLNTDAEGRLVLADGLSLAVEAGVDAIVDLATLTGAAVQALGTKIAAVMGTSDDLMAQVQAAAERSGEAVWPLPLPEVYRRHIDSEVADIKNMGVPNQNGTITGGMFLKEFVADVPWVHLDIAGVARSEEDEGAVTKGGTGYGVRLLLELVSQLRRPVVAKPARPTTAER